LYLSQNRQESAFCTNDSLSRGSLKNGRSRTKSDIQFATVAAYYYRFEAPLSDRKETIDADDLKNAARLANWRRFSKPYVPLNNARMQGYLDRAGGGAFRINAVGENLVAMTLPGTAAVGKAPRPTRKRVSRKRGQGQIKKPKVS
jgi:hypothetical protein